MKDYPVLTKAETIIMEALWEEDYITVVELSFMLKRKLPWSRQALKVYLKQLVEKGMLTVDKVSERKHYYSPAVSKEAYAANKASEYLGTYFDDLSHMVAGIIKAKDISDEELETLEEFIKNYKGSKEQK